MSNEEKIKVLITSSGYMIHPDISWLCREEPFGFIVHQALEKYHNNETHTVPATRKTDILTQMSTKIYGSSFKATVDPRIRSLPLLMSDRDQFVASFTTGLDSFFSNNIEVHNTWNPQKRTVCQELYVQSEEDLLLYDIGKVIERGIYFRSCAFCGKWFLRKRKQEKYCLDHRIEGQKKTREQNFKANRCSRLKKKICDRLKNRVNGGQVAARSSILEKTDLDKFLAVLYEQEDKYKQGHITEQDFYEWLVEQDEINRIYKKHK